MFMCFFPDPDPDWWTYREALGIQKVVDSLKAKGLPSDWPMKTVDPKDPDTLKDNVHYKSQCPYYRGYWLHGGCGSVECSAAVTFTAGEILPGVVWYELCHDKHTQCPFYKEERK